MQLSAARLLSAGAEVQTGLRGPSVACQSGCCLSIWAYAGSVSPACCKAWTQADILGHLHAASEFV